MKSPSAIYMIRGDMDYVIARCTDSGQRSDLLDVEFEGKRLDPNRAMKMRFGFHEPVEDGVLTDFPNPDVGGTLILSKKALDVLRPMLDVAGVVLPAEPEHPWGYHLFAPYRSIDALDQERSDLTRLDSGTIWNVGRHVLRPEMIGDADVFHLRHQRRRLYVSDRFMALVSQHRLSGLEVCRVWSTTHGGVEIANPDKPFERFPPGFGTTLWEKRKAMRDMIAGVR